MEANQTYTISIIAEADADPFTGYVLPTDRETLAIRAASLDGARKLAPVYMTIKARGRLVRFFFITALNCSAISNQPSISQATKGTQTMNVQLWQHRTSGEVFAVRLMGEHGECVVDAWGPLTESDQEYVQREGDFADGDIEEAKRTEGEDAAAAMAAEWEATVSQYRTIWPYEGA